MNRRNFLKTIAATTLTMALKPEKALSEVNQVVSKDKKAKEPDLVAVMGGEPDQMFRKALAEMGGIKRYVKKGQKVTVKPNIGWDRVPELAGNTNPLLIAEIVKECLSAGASEVRVFDHTCDDWVRCYQNSGIKEAVEKAGGKMVPANQESYYREIELPNGKSLNKAKVHEAILDSDVWINVPVLKHHGGSNLSISMKNHMGIVWDRRSFHAKGLQQCIADICTLEHKAVLHVVDAYRIVKTNGPQGRSDADVVLAKGLFVSSDIVAVDTAATAFFNQVREMPLASVKHIAFAQEAGLGSMDLDNLTIKRIKL